MSIVGVIGIVLLILGLTHVVPFWIGVIVGAVCIVIGAFGLTRGRNTTL